MTNNGTRWALLGVTAATAVGVGRAVARRRHRHQPERQDGWYVVRRGVTGGPAPGRGDRLLDRPRTAGPRAGRVGHVAAARRAALAVRGPRPGRRGRPQWRAEITVEGAGTLRWRVEDGPVPQLGRIELTEAPQGRGTEIRAELRYRSGPVRRLGRPGRRRRAGPGAAGRAAAGEVADRVWPGGGHPGRPVRPEPRPGEGDRQGTGDADDGRTGVRALCWEGVGKLAVRDVPEPQIRAEGDIIVRVRASSVCGSDLHLINGYLPAMREGDILGHEFMGEVVETGPGVRRHRGRRPGGGAGRWSPAVAAGTAGPSSTRSATTPIRNRCSPRSCGGTRRPASSATRTPPAGTPAITREYIRVPFGDIGAFAVPDGVPDDSVVFASDAMPTGWMAADFCGVHRRRGGGRLGRRRSRSDGGPFGATPRAPSGSS